MVNVGIDRTGKTEVVLLSISSLMEKANRQESNSCPLDLIASGLLRCDKLCSVYASLFGSSNLVDFVFHLEMLVNLLRDLDYPGWWVSQCLAKSLFQEPNGS